MGGVRIPRGIHRGSRPFGSAGAGGGSTTGRQLTPRFVRSRCRAVRQTEPHLGDRILVMGQGLVGLLIHKSVASCRGARDGGRSLPSRRSFLSGTGRRANGHPGRTKSQRRSASLDRWIRRRCGGDLHTATQANTPIEQAAEACRDRGQLVDVGITKIELPGNFSAKRNWRLDFRVPMGRPLRSEL